LEGFLNCLKTLSYLNHLPSKLESRTTTLTDQLEDLLPTEYELITEIHSRIVNLCGDIILVPGLCENDEMVNYLKDRLEELSKFIN
jgi:hypothetical protein